MRDLLDNPRRSGYIGTWHLTNQRRALKGWIEGGLLREVEDA